MLVRTMAILLALGIALPAMAQGIPKAQSPEEVGFVATRLKRLSDRIEEGVKNNELPGAVVLIVRNGKIVTDAYFAPYVAGNLDAVDRGNIHLGCAGAKWSVHNRVWLYMERWQPASPRAETLKAEINTPSLGGV